MINEDQFTPQVCAGCYQPLRTDRDRYEQGWRIYCSAKCMAQSIAKRLSRTPA